MADLLFILKYNLDYDSSTGEFTRKHTKYKYKAGDIAGSKNNRDGYVYIRVDGKRYQSHRLAWIYMYGNIPEGHEIDHINHNRSDNRISNLRLVTRKENAKNLSIRKDSSSGVSGVSYHKKDKAFRSYVTINGKYIHLGNFKNLQDAIHAREVALESNSFHVNHGRVL